jgi:hypothetical protein
VTSSPETAREENNIHVNSDVETSQLNLSTIPRNLSSTPNILCSNRFSVLENEDDLPLVPEPEPESEPENGSEPAEPEGEPANFLTDKPAEPEPNLNLKQFVDKSGNLITVGCWPPRPGY